MAAIILAAGASTRLGTPKQLVEAGGESLIRRTVRTVLGSQADSTIVVLGHRFDEIGRELVGLDIELTIAGDYAQGLSHSLRHGLNFIAGDGRSFDAVLFVPCDLPFLTTEHLDAVMSVYRDTSTLIVCTSFADTLGIPALFDASQWPQFEGLSGDRGARKIIDQCPDKQSVAFEAAAFDLDTPDDVRRWMG